uniref:Phosphate transporter n=1 Tax=Globodera pallida TaxID=36090 RepID=A0A183CER8_GLOPA
MSSPLTFSSTIFSTPTCAIAVFHNAYLWALVVGFVLSFVLGFGMGANDVANAFGTSVGSNVLTVRNAFILATIMETLGAVLVGSNVTNALQEMLKRRLYANHPSQLLLGQLAILGGGSAWLMTATLLRLPVSSTHSIVGAILGFTLVMNGLEGVSWKTVVKITLSWPDVQTCTTTDDRLISALLLEYP